MYRRNISISSAINKYIYTEIYQYMRVKHTLTLYGQKKGYKSINHTRRNMSYQSKSLSGLGIDSSSQNAFNVKHSEKVLHLDHQKVTKENLF